MDRPRLVQKLKAFYGTTSKGNKQGLQRNGGRQNKFPLAGKYLASWRTRKLTRMTTKNHKVAA
jgi:hypothetical protein